MEVSNVAHPTVPKGVGPMLPVPVASANGTLLGAPPAGTHGARFYLSSGASVTFTIAPTQPSAAPAATFTISLTGTGPNWDEDLYGQFIYVTAVTGSPFFRYY